jgi:uncharacterized membrane protein YhaH (DUF805 family)
MNNLVGNFIGFEGRLNRQPFWLSAIVLAVISLILSLVILPLFGLSMMPSFDFSGGEVDLSGLAAIQSRSAWISFVMFLIFLYPSAAICIKRRHDRNNNGIDVWIYLGLTALLLLLQALGIGMNPTEIPGVGTIPTPGPILTTLSIIVGIFAIYLLVVLGFLKGTAGANSYGPDPLQG